MNDLLESSQLKTICENHGISYLGLFGSHARGENNKDSDIDLLAKFSKPVGYFGLVRAQRQLSKYLGKEVDLVTKGALSERIFPYVQKNLKTIYES
jgi:uncharacterized protein